MKPQATIEDIQFAPERSLSLETGRIAKQADGSVVVRLGDTMVLSTATISDSVRESNFFPLTVDYREKFAAGGKVPGGFIKREGRPTDKETLTSRLIDRAIRPLFPDGFYHDVHVVNFVISAGQDYDADVLAGVGSSAALMTSGAPFQGPIAEVRVARVDGEFVINPTMQQTAESDMDLIVAGKEDALVMVEGEADEVSEEDMIDALDEAHKSIRTLCRGQHQLVEAYGEPEPFEWEADLVPDALVDKMKQQYGRKVADAIRGEYSKEKFYQGIDAIKEEATADLLGDAKETPEGYTRDDIHSAVENVQKDEMRSMIVQEGQRIDGRGEEDVRDLWMEVGYLPRVHGSAIFTRGETQVLGSVTLGTSEDVQAVDEVFAETDKTFYLHYRFPPFSVGEASYLRGPKRREIGHSMLAERALRPVIPEQEQFPYTIRINADVMESNGSSSMASVCAGSLALMDAGVPIEKPVAGIAMGLVQHEDETKVLTDILGQEDHLGDMDFKITGTRDGVTACQMDMKIEGLSRDVLLKALKQARKAREFILDEMEETISEPREDLSKYAPRLTKLQIDPDRIGAVIGPGGKVVKSIQKETNTEISVDEDEGVGIVTIAATNQNDAEAAIERVKQIVAVPEEGEDYIGTVKGIRDFGAFIEIMPERTGLLHVSEISHEYVEDIEEYLQVGDKVKVHLLEVKDDGKMRLTRKPFLSEEDEETADQ
ncbi:polyribonucleotide nucleotidyltransferase [Salinibacter sp. 10B]|uniref:polyribonucleotide nucleotidyltransferase n=1 Tax=Salinibacter sp. 10B TaxID=1923971 RepID=UPI000CF392F8|nr:polyribonucleotide nucleotidyltransferase [Salinibacter sp. 10B]PQJ33464.1 polyribonucleotide nucleotidyltransferase [Salinibacter sp. 10B]